MQPEVHTGYSDEVVPLLCSWSIFSGLPRFIFSESDKVWCLNVSRAASCGVSACAVDAVP